MGIQETGAGKDVAVNGGSQPLPDIDPLVNIIARLIGVEEAVGIGLEFVLAAVGTDHGVPGNSVNIFSQFPGTISRFSGEQPEGQGYDPGRQLRERITPHLTNQVVMGVVRQFMAQDDGEFIVGAA